MQDLLQVNICASWRHNKSIQPFQTKVQGHSTNEPVPQPARCQRNQCQSITATLYNATPYLTGSDRLNTLTAAMGYFLQKICSHLMLSRVMVSR